MIRILVNIETISGAICPNFLLYPFNRLCFTHFVTVSILNNVICSWCQHLLLAKHYISMKNASLLSFKYGGKIIYGKNVIVHKNGNFVYNKHLMITSHIKQHHEQSIQ